MKKQAELSTDTKKELAQTGVMAAAGGATGYAGHKLMQTSAMKGMKIPEGGKAALAVGGLGLLGDYAAVKMNRHIEKKAKEMTNKYLEKIAADYSQEDLDAIMGSGTQRALGGVFGMNSRAKGLGYDSNTRKMLETSKNGMQWKQHMLRDAIGVLGGAGAGALASIALKRDLSHAGVGALGGAALGGIISSGMNAHSHWKRDGGLETQLKADLASGKYGYK